MKAIVVTDQAAETIVLVLHGGGPVGAYAVKPLNVSRT
jgi:hypothetical protein